MDVGRIGGGVIGTFIDALGWDQTIARISTWSQARESRYVCFCNVHSVVTTGSNETFRGAVESADLALPDGMPVAWMLRRLGFAGQERINGPDLMWKYCAHAEATGQSVYFLGSSDEVLNRLRLRLKDVFPRLRVAGRYSPPFRSMTAEEDIEMVCDINRSGAGVVFVGLGCPKQEIWMAGHRGRINAVMVGVGAAFALHAGTVKRAPTWMQNIGMEWLHRLASEPQRLWKRYLVTNTVFVIKAAVQLAYGSLTAVTKLASGVVEREAAHRALPLRNVERTFERTQPPHRLATNPNGPSTHGSSHVRHIRLVSLNKNMATHHETIEGQIIKRHERFAAR